jgi:hypothetical protein
MAIPTDKPKGQNQVVAPPKVARTTKSSGGNKTPTSTATTAAVAATPVVDPYAQYAAQQASMRAQADAAQASLDAQRNTTNRQIFRQVMGSYFNLATDSSWIDALFDSAKKYYDQDITGDAAVELLLREENAPKQFKDRFSAYLNTNSKRSAAGMAPEFGSLAEYVATEKAYTNKLKSYGAFADLATQDNIKKFIENEVSVDEVASRIDNAYYAISTADAALKEQIKNQFPSLDDNDLARSLVTGSTDSIQQKIKFGAAAIATEARAAGMQAASDLTDLAKQGVTREQARTAFQRIGQEQAGIQQAARSFGRQLGQQELEQEAFGVKPSATAKALRSQARAEFAGQTGIVTGSLKKPQGKNQL